MVLQRGDVVVAHCQLRAGIDLVPDRRHRWVNWLTVFPWSFTDKRSSPSLKLWQHDNLNHRVFIPELSPCWTSFTVHWQQCCAEGCQNTPGSMGICIALSVNTPTDPLASLTCCCSQGGPGHDTQQLSLEFPYRWESASPGQWRKWEVFMPNVQTGNWLVFQRQMVARNGV